MQVGENCEHIDHANFAEAIAGIRASLALSTDEVLRRKQACRSSALFHPLSFVGKAQVLFPDLGEDLS